MANRKNVEKSEPGKLVPHDSVVSDSESAKLAKRESVIDDAANAPVVEDVHEAVTPENVESDEAVVVAVAPPVVSEPVKEQLRAVPDNFAGIVRFPGDGSMEFHADNGDIVVVQRGVPDIRDE